MYRNGKLKDALALIDSLGSEDPGVAELRGQLLHRLGKVNESKDVYHKLALDLAKSARKVKVNPDLIGKYSDSENILIAATFLSLKSTPSAPEITQNHPNGKI